MNPHANNPLGTAAVTGASGGIGRVYADRLAARGHDLLLVARRGDRLDVAARELSDAHGVQVSTLVADLSTASGRTSVVERLAAESQLTLLVNNAGTATLAPLARMKTAQAADMLAVNVVALTELAMAVLPGFLARGRGTLVNLGSVLGFATLPTSSVYSGTKAFVYLFTRGLQDEVQGTGVRVQLVLPSATATDIWETAGHPLPDPTAANVMTVADCVDAALAGLDAGEQVTMPSVEQAGLLDPMEAARIALFKSAQQGRPASRYRLAGAASKQ